jgi:histidinol-phosphate aminotransferase
MNPDASPTPRAAVQRMRPYHPPLEGRDGLRLDFNENTAGCSPRVLEALRGLSADDLAQYPRYRAAETEIAAHFGLPAEAVLMTNGVDDAIALTLATFADPGDAVLVIEPTFAMYRFYAERAGLEVRALAYRDSGGGLEREFTLDVDELAAALRGPGAPRMVMLANPNNPTGSWLAPEAVRTLAEAHPGVLFFVDEAYADFAPAPEGVLGDVERLPNLIVARTFSKAHGLAALRLGLLAAPAGLMPFLRRAQAPYNVNALALVCARAALGDRGWLANYRREALAGRAELGAALTRLGRAWWRSAGNFVLFETGAPAAEVVGFFQGGGVHIRDRSRDVANTARITCGTLAHTRRAIALLEAFYRRPRPAPSAAPEADTRPVIVFDMDGVLVDVRGSYRAAIAAAVRELGGGEVADDEIQELKEAGGYNNDWDLAGELLRRRGRAAARAAVVAAFDQAYRGAADDGLCRRETWLLPSGTLAALRRRYRLAIFTGRPRAEALAALRRFGVEDAFAACIALEDVTRGKPDPEGLRRLAERFAPAPLLALLGDSVDDARAARAAGVPFIGVVPPGHPRPTALRRVFAELGASDVADDVVIAAAELITRRVEA